MHAGWVRGEAGMGGMYSTFGVTTLTWAQNPSILDLDACQMFCDAVSM